MTQMNLNTFLTKCKETGVHTVEVAVVDTFAHLRGKRVPVDRYFAEVAEGGAAIADAIYILGMDDDIVEHATVNMDSGFLDTRIVPDLESHRLLTHRPGYGLVFCSSLDEHGTGPHELSPRDLLAAQVERCRVLGVDPVVATEPEFYLCTVGDDGAWTPVRSYIKYSSLTDAPDLEVVLADMRAGLAGAGIEVESSNQEYGPGQIEVNTGPTDAMRAADDFVLYRSVVKQVAEQHGMRATFMPKPFTEDSGSGLHVHTSLRASDGSNAFADSDGAPNEPMGHWVAGILEHAEALVLLGAPTATPSPLVASSGKAAEAKPPTQVVKVISRPPVLVAPPRPTAPGGFAPTASPPPTCTGAWTTGRCWPGASWRPARPPTGWSSVPRERTPTRTC